MEAANHHQDAAKRREAGNYAQAAYGKLLVLGRHTIAGEFLSDGAKHHAQALKCEPAIIFNLFIARFTAFAGIGNK